VRPGSTGDQLPCQTGSLAAAGGDQPGHGGGIGEVQMAEGLSRGRPRPTGSCQVDLQRDRPRSIAARGLALPLPPRSFGLHGGSSPQLQLLAHLPEPHRNEPRPGLVARAQGVALLSM